VTSIGYLDALDEALCVGWVDSLVKSLDASRYARKFTPRRVDSRWSPINRKRYAALKAAGRLAPSGIDRAPTNRGYGPRPPRFQMPRTLPRYIQAALRKQPAAWRYFQTAPSQRRSYIGWIESAKREQTKLRRPHLPAIPPLRLGGLCGRGRLVATALAGTIALLPGSMTLSAQASIDDENRYANVGAIMVWRVDDGGKPLHLLGFVSGTLIRDRVMVTAGHFTAPATALGSLPPSVRIFASFSPTDARDPKSWIPVVGQATHPSMPHCPPPPQCDPTDEILVAPLQPGIADVGLVFLAHAPPGIEPARFAPHGTLDRSEGAPTTIVGYGTTTPLHRHTPPDPALWDGKRRIRSSILRRVVDETWGLWAIPSYICSGDSGGGIFLDVDPAVSDDPVLVANVSDGGLDCRRHNNNNRLDTHGIQSWIDHVVRRP
jgi:hypothetical protein